jgi:hypothetical protein
MRDGARGEVAGRLCVIRKSEDAIRKAQRRLRRKDSKKQKTLKPETFEFARYVMVFTTYEQGSATQVLQWYRMRWQEGTEPKEQRQQEERHLMKGGDTTSPSRLNHRNYRRSITIPE